MLPNPFFIIKPTPFCQCNRAAALIDLDMFMFLQHDFTHNMDKYSKVILCLLKSGQMFSKPLCHNVNLTPEEQSKNYKYTKMQMQYSSVQTRNPATILCLNIYIYIYIKWSVAVFFFNF